MTIVLESPRIVDGLATPSVETICAQSPTSARRLTLFAVVPILVLVALQCATFEFSEPIFFGDENRHVMTSIFFRDLLADRPLTGLRGYAENYYVQYPALGLLIWPPLFHALTGAVMLVAGTSSLVATLMVGLSAVIACVYLFRLTARTHDAATASLAVLLFGLCPLIFDFSRHVMLEMPTLMWGLIATFHFVRFLDESRRRDIFIAAVASACAALTRFDAVYLLPMFGILLTARGQWRLLKRWDVWSAAVVALLMVLPYYALVASEIGGLHVRQASESVVPHEHGDQALSGFLYYLWFVPKQVGWFVTVAALVGLLRMSSTAARRRMWPFLAMLLATYATFAPLAEVHFRHSIYWVPAIVVLAVEGISEIWCRLIQTKGIDVVLPPQWGSNKSAQGNALGTNSHEILKPCQGDTRPTVEVVSPLQGLGLFARSATQGVALGWLIAAPLGRNRKSTTSTITNDPTALTRWRFELVSALVLAIATGATTVAKERPTIRGYEDAARFVLEHSSESNFCLFDGWWDGNFTYQLRHLDRNRRLSVLRGDKLFYGFICVPDTDYTEYATTDREMLDLIDRQSPEYIVVEEPQIMTHIPAAERLRTLLREHPDQFVLAKTIPVRGGKLVRDYELRIYHNLRVQTGTGEPVEFDVLGLGKSVRSKGAPHSKSEQP